MVAFSQHNRIEERAAADGTHEVLVKRDDIIEEAEVDGRVQFAGFGGEVVGFFHLATGFEAAHSAEAGGAEAVVAGF